jgi:cytochrome P450
MTLPATHLKLPPGPKVYNLLGIIPEMRRRDATILKKYIDEFGDILRFKVGPRALYLINHPDYIRQVLQSNFPNYSKETRAWRMLRVILGPSVMITAGEIWKKRRRLMQPLFNPPAISQLFPMMNRVIGEMLEEFSQKAKRNEEMEIRWEMMKVTLRVISETIMGRDVGGRVDDIGNALWTILEHIADSYTSLFNTPLYIPTSRNIKFRKALRVLNDIVCQFIAERRKSIDRPDDLLSRLMEATDPETGHSLTDGEIRDEIMTMFLAGHETTASSIAWTWILLDQYPQVEEELFREVNSQLQNWPPTKDDIIKLKYTIQVVEEALRLYPPVYIVSRRAEKEDEMGGFRIPEKSTVFFSPYILHRDERFWSDPEQFDPDRFSHANKAKIRPYTYLPFIEGPRKCLGYHFAMLESPLILAAVARNFRLRLVPGQDIQPYFSITLRPKSGIRMILEKR